MGLPFRRADAEKTLRAVAADGNAQAKAILHVELLFRVVAKEGGEELRSDPGERSRTTAEPGPCCRSSYATAEQPRHLAGAAIHHPENGLEIGREAGRERGCEDVEMSGVDEY